MARPGVEAAGWLSGASDLIIVATFTALVSSRGLTRTQGLLGRLVVWLSCADFLTCISAVINNTALAAHDETLCVVLGIFLWYGTWSAWLWTAAYAHAVYHCFRREQPLSGWERFQWSPSSAGGNEWLYHACCWGCPALLVCVVYLVGGRFGAEEGVCTSIGVPAEPNADTNPIARPLKPNYDAPQRPDSYLRAMPI
jgi:hypothetical protein